MPPQGQAILAEQHHRSFRGVQDFESLDGHHRRLCVDSDICSGMGLEGECGFETLVTDPL